MVQRGWAKRCASFESSSALRSEVFHPKMQFIELSPAERFETPLNGLAPDILPRTIRPTGTENSLYCAERVSQYKLGLLNVVMVSTMETLSKRRPIHS